MRIKHPKTVGVILCIQVVLVWFYIVSRPEDSVREHMSLSPNILNEFNRQVQLTKVINKMNRSNQRTTKPVIKELHVTQGDCTGINYPLNLIKEDGWSVIDEAKTAYVFSAYIVYQSGKIKVVGASAMSTLKLFCQYWFVTQGNNSVIMYEKPSTLYMLPESHGDR